MKKRALNGTPLIEKNGEWTGCALSVGSPPKPEPIAPGCEQRTGLYENESADSVIDRLKKHKEMTKDFDLESYLEIPCIYRGRTARE